MVMHSGILLRTPEEALAWLRQRSAAGAQLHSDSRQVRPGDVFLAWPGRAQDGREHVCAAVQAGAAAVLAEAGDAWPQLWQAQAGQAHIALYEGLQQAAGMIADAWHGFPSREMQVLAVTGTNGKTTLAWWLAHALTQQGVPCGYIGTLGVGVPAVVQETGLTSPDALRLQRTLQLLRDQGVRACAVEASSIGLEQGRLNGTRIAIAVFTNLTQDHLDYHGDMQSYGRAKQILFEWTGLQAAVVNAQDVYGQGLCAIAGHRGVAVWDYAVQAEGLPPALARLTASEVEFVAEGAVFTLREYAHSQPDRQAQPLQRLRVRAQVTGVYNVQNALAFIGALRAHGTPLEQAAALCLHLPAVPGRMQVVPGGETGPQVVVDYAHTPDALRVVLRALRPVAQQRGGRLVVVFGCGGDRDRGKRPLMAQAAVQCADVVWVTSDNPRGEEPISIIEHTIEGLTPEQRQYVCVCVDRREAIARALMQADASDVVLIAGKGHENYQEIKGMKHPFSDLEEAQRALAARGADPRAEEATA